MEDDSEDAGNVFRIPDLWAPSPCLKQSCDDGDFLFSRLRLEDFDTKPLDTSTSIAIDSLFFSKPDFAFEPSDAITTEPQNDAVDNVSEIDDQASLDLDEIWLFPEDQNVKPGCHVTWNSFINSTCREQGAYLTESHASVFDAALAADEEYLRLKNSEHTLVGTKVYMLALLSLAQGRTSAFFSWNEEKRSFYPSYDRIRISGYCGEILLRSATLFLESGNTTRLLKVFVESCYSKHDTPGRIALAEAISSTLVSVQSHLSASGPRAKTLLQLEALLKPAHTVLNVLKRIVNSVSTTRSDEAMLSTIFQETQILEHRPDNIRHIMLEVLSKVSSPWLEFSNGWLGIQKEIGLPMNKTSKSKAFVKIANKEWVNEQGEELSEPDFILDYDRVPSFIAPDDARSLFEVGRSLRVLRSHHPEHPLSRVDNIVKADSPALTWCFSWTEIARVEEKALTFERDLISTIRKYSQSGDIKASTEKTKPEDRYELDFFGRAAEDMEAHLLLSIDALNQQPSENASSDTLSVKVSEYLRCLDPVTHDEKATLAPPISLASVLSFNPIIAAQARIVNGACMRMLFRSHNLRDHLRLQKDFHLFGNGVFSTRLSHALFNPELESAERKKGVARSGGVMGLRLGGRATWPPASSELRLALMGILAESYDCGQTADKASKGTFLEEKALPGDLSFAVRDMSDQEIQRCLDPDSNEALDFLRLSYKAPAPLDAVITPVILFKYDQIFKLLLRVLRMLFTTSALFRDNMGRNPVGRQASPIAQRFTTESQHFISSVSGYFFGVGVESTWRLFERKLDEVETRLDDEQLYSLGASEGLDKLRDYHEMMLDRISSALLLRKRQQPVMNLLEEIFVLILQFSKYSRLQGISKESQELVDGSIDVNSLYATFRHKVRVFVNVCRGLSEKKGYFEQQMSRGTRYSSLFDGSDLVEENTIAQLLTRLDLTGHYE